MMGYWKTRDGKIIRISDMQDNHLLNALRQSQERLRDVDTLIGRAYSCGAPDADTEAGYYYEVSLDDAHDDSVKLSVTARVLSEEVENRGLKPLPLRETGMKLTA